MSLPKKASVKEVKEKEEKPKEDPKAALTEKALKVGVTCSFCGTNSKEAGKLDLVELEGKKGVYFVDCGRKHKEGAKPVLAVKSDDSPSGILEIQTKDL